MKVFTEILRVRQVVYAIGDVVVPPFFRRDYGTVLAFSGTFLLTFWLFHILSVSLPLEWVLPVYLAPASFAAWIANQPKAEGRSIGYLVWGLLRWPFRKRLMATDAEFRRRPRWRA